MRLGKFVKTPSENKRYTIDYDDWLDVSETISSLTFSVSPTTSSMLTAGSTAIAGDGRSAQFYVAAGLNGTQYTVTTTMTTTNAQIKQDTILYSVRTP